MEEIADGEEKPTQEVEEDDTILFIKKHPLKISLAIAIFLFYIGCIMGVGSIAYFLMETSLFIVIEALILFVPNYIWMSIIEEIGNI